MGFTAIITVLTTVFSMAVKVVGMPSQIKNNHRRKSTSGLSTWFMISTLISYALWVVHGLEVHDESLVIGQGLGTIVTLVIIAQMFMYRKNKSDGMDIEDKPSKPPLLWYSLMQSSMLRRKTNVNQPTPDE